MNIIFINIPVGIKKYELAGFIESSVNASERMQEKLYVPLGDIDIMQLQEVDMSSQKQYGLVRIGYPDIAKKIIKELNGRVFNKFQVTAREFFLRSEKNDPRLQYLDVPEVFEERRVDDRRKHTLISLGQV